MNKTHKRTLYISLVMFAVFVGLMTIATFFDFEISKAIADLENRNYYSSNVFGRIFEVIGECPIYLISAFACSIIYQNFAKREKNFINIAVRVIAIAFCGAMLFYMFYKIFKYLSIFFDFSDQLGDVLDYIGYFVLAGIFTFVLMYLTKKFNIKFLNNMLVWAFIVIATAILSQVLAQGVKYFAGRPRFRTLFALDDYSLFKRWYQFSGHVKPTAEMLQHGVASDAFKSFPSGHSAACAMLICITAIPCLFDNLNKKSYKALYWVIAVVSTLTVMISRMVMGAHYLSDVLTGAFITVVSFYICSFIVKLFFKKVIKLSPLESHKGISLLEEADEKN